MNIEIRERRGRVAIGAGATRPVTVRMRTIDILPEGARRALGGAALPLLVAAGAVGQLVIGAVL